MNPIMLDKDSKYQHELMFLNNYKWDMKIDILDLFVERTCQPEPHNDLQPDTVIIIPQEND